MESGGRPPLILEKFGGVSVKSVLKHSDDILGMLWSAHGFVICLCATSRPKTYFMSRR